MTQTPTIAQREEMAQAMRDLVEIWEHETKIYDYDRAIYKAISAWEQYDEMRDLLFQYMKLNLTGDIQERAHKILQETGYLLAQS